MKCYIFQHPSESYLRKWGHTENIKILKERPLDWMTIALPTELHGQRGAGNGYLGTAS